MASARFNRLAMPRFSDCRSRRRFKHSAQHALVGAKHVARRDRLQLCGLGKPGGGRYEGKWCQKVGKHLAIGSRRKQDRDANANNPEQSRRDMFQSHQPLVWFP
mmetsp:Transcript_8118/g.26965  ORF Transcript_8118/g.26965 Transcript_8118/m.26965 type:complete len:104 (+) Transcript_8118:788-1099(+)